MASHRRAAPKLMTAEELEQMPDDGYRYDLIGGVLVKMSPANFEHGRLAAQIAWLLTDFASVKVTTLMAVTCYPASGCASPRCLKSGTSRRASGTESRSRCPR